ncbi:MAG: ring-cleaving dioxygenase, partial [Chitinophagaceae bacterium]
LAFATHNKETQEEVRLRIVKRMLNPTAILDRSYFTSIYFREPGGVLFEVATEGPGFATDELVSDLGSALKLPPQYEEDRAKIENSLTPVSFNMNEYK